jgi:protein-tyrosine-phosphatase
MMGFRLGFTAFLGSKAALLAMLIGFCYAGLCVCTTLIFLDCRENTYCVPMHCGSSMLSGLTAAFALALFLNQSVPSAAQLVSGGLIVVALVFLSPLHHFQRYLGKLKHSLASVYQRLRSLLPLPGKGEPVASGGIAPLLADNAADALQRTGAQGSVLPLPKMFLFVCSGNTCRSPIAASIGNAEIAARLRMPFEALGSAPWRAISAGISARVGAPMTQEAQRALRLLNIPVVPHKARKLTVELSRQVDRIFCMTQAHRNAVIKMIPSAAEKTHCLDPDADIEDPIGSGLEAYVKCAQRIHSLVQLRLSEIGLHG